MDGVLPGFGVVTVADEIGIYEVKKIFGWVDLSWHHVALGSEVVSGFN